MLTVLAFLISPAFATVQLFISIYAQKKKKNTGSNLMVVGSLLMLVHASITSYLSYSAPLGPAEDTDRGFYLEIMAYTSVASMVGRILFLVGLTLFIQSIVSGERNWKVLDRED
ncbi:hypothetical protein [Lewinella sp. W8]|uniref:hypothetical protein n=1 Tax=Lewinella sp. W8 TaxID=2528208 RepID=UPI001067ACE4|nr:hypothetical protein [Lewinella sp. W8]MTB51002.1 hypothetical protein [Lewinella sp. W8]